MISRKMLSIALLALAAGSAQASTKDFNVKYRQTVIEDGRTVHETRRQNYGFRMEILSDNEGVKSESYRDGRPFITALKGENYSVRLYNPLPVRVAVNLTVDGLNSISGQPSGIADGHKWMIDPYSSVTIPGWQVTGGEARRFFFTDKPKSYAKWRGDMTGKDLAANCGVIGAAFFWNQQELDQYFAQHPFYRYTRNYYPYDEVTRSKAANRSSADYGSAASGAPACAPAQEPAVRDMMKKSEEREQAGTGMGERESHPTTQVSFDYNAGMYSLDKALVVYYDFAKAQVPNPFPAVGYSPEMP